MQTFPDPPRSYSLIKNLLPSVSLDGEISDDGKQKTNLKTNPEITSQTDEIIQTVQNTSIDDLKEVLKNQLISLQILSGSQRTDSQQQNSPSDELIIAKLKQLKLITDVMVERMNEKYKEAQHSFQELEKTIKAKNKLIGVRSFHYWKRQSKNAEKKFEESQSTQRKAKIFNSKLQERLVQSDRKKTRKQQEKQKSSMAISKKI